MPRRRSVIRGGTIPDTPPWGSSAILGQSGDHAFGSVHLVAERSLHLRVEREVDVDARAEADEPVALPAHELRALLDIAQDAPCNQAGDLHARDVVARAGAKPQRVALVVAGSLVE